jgi:hypothetical protein
VRRDWSAASWQALRRASFEAILIAEKTAEEAEEREN